MFIPDGLPYIPRLYESRTKMITATTDPVLLLPYDSKRILIYIQAIPPLIGANPTFVLNQLNENGTTFSLPTKDLLHLFWDNWYTLCNMPVFATGYGIGATFSVTEVIYNQQDLGEKSHATRKPETLAAKVKRYLAKQ